MSPCNSFPPIIDQAAKVIVLGSIPGIASLKQQQYYAHPRNAFWYILSRYFNVEIAASYEARIELLSRHNVALWDVLCSCERSGSLDVNIESGTIAINDFSALYEEKNRIRAVLFNGAKAEAIYRRHVLPSLATKHQSLQLFRLPSTSPAMASLTKEEKYQVWSNVLSRFV